jgi:molybdopterin/thiamine biosynthesis adenylyltransferase
VSQEAGPYTRATERPKLSAPPPVQPLLWSPIEGPALDGDHVVGGDIPLPDRLPSLRVVLCGAGALGSWAAAVIAASRFPDVDMCLIDMDDTIEAHNLNRQVLFGDADIGLPKARRALEKLKEIDPEMRLQALQVMVEPTMLDELTVGGDVRVQISDETLEAEINAYRAQIDALAKALSRATALLSCPDNHQTRWCLNIISERLGIPLINGAVEGLVGVVHVCDPADHGRCLVCWLGESIWQEPERKSCSDLVGDAPVPSIVTSAAVIGAAQAAALIAQATGLASPVKRYHALDGLKYGTLDGVKRLFSGYRAADRNPAECPSHLVVPTESAPTR